MSHLVDHLNLGLEEPTALPVDAPRESRCGGPDEDVVYVPVLRTPAKALPPGALPAAQLYRAPLDAVREYRSAAACRNCEDVDSASCMTHPTPAVATVRHLDLYRTVLNAIPHGPTCGSERTVGIDCACDFAAQEAEADAVTRAVEGLLRGVGIGVDQRTGTAWDTIPTLGPGCRCTAWPGDTPDVDTTGCPVHDRPTVDSGEAPF